MYFTYTASWQLDYRKQTTSNPSLFYPVWNILQSVHSDVYVCFKMETCMRSSFKVFNSKVSACMTEVSLSMSARRTPRLGRTAWRLILIGSYWVYLVHLAFNNVFMIQSVCPSLTLHHHPQGRTAPRWARAGKFDQI